MLGQNLLKKVWQDPLYFLAFGFGSGLINPAPGTWGTLAALPVYLLMMNLPPLLYLLITVLAFGLGVWLCDKVSKDLGVHDYKGIVWDEIVGYLLTMFLVPQGIYWMGAGFVLFRIFDIWKPQPIKYLDERIHGGLGIMLDDVVAAVPAWIVLQFVAWGIQL